MSIKKLPSLDGMERIPQTVLSEKLDEMIERIERENVGFVITEDGKDKYVLCPCNWYGCYWEKDFGCMVNSAIRNELKRHSENTEAVQNFILNHYESFDLRTVSVAIEDIERAICSPLRTLENPMSWNGIRNLLVKRLSQLEGEEDAYGDNTVTIEIQVDAELHAQVQEILDSMGWTIEEWVQRFIEWCVNPETKDEAEAWMLKCKEEML